MTETETKTFFSETETFVSRGPNFLTLIPEVFSETKFFETNTKTFFLRPNFLKPKPEFLRPRLNLRLKLGVSNVFDNFWSGTKEMCLRTLTTYLAGFPNFWRSHLFIERNGIEIRENKHYNRDKYIFGCFTILDEASFFIMVDLVLVGVH